jgi:hypothetical protein
MLLLGSPQHGTVQPGNARACLQAELQFAPKARNGGERDVIQRRDMAQREALKRSVPVFAVVFGRQIGDIEHTKPAEWFFERNVHASRSCPQKLTVSGDVDRKSDASAHSASSEMLLSYSVKTA